MRERWLFPLPGINETSTNKDMNLSPNFQTSFSPAYGTPVDIAPCIVRITAPNSGPYTFTGTNSFILGKDACVIVDPGPAIESHLNALLSHVADCDVTAIILTHTHKDHSSLAPEISARLGGVPFWFGGKHHLSRPLRRLERNPLAASCDWDLVPDRILEDGDLVEAGGLHLRIVATPGHCANHLAFDLEGTPFTLTGDHIMGWNSTLVGPPDGAMMDYFHSLDRMIALGKRTYLPAHGPSIEDGLVFAQALKAHRMQRNDQIVAGVGQGDRTINQLVSRLYPDATFKIRQAAAMTVEAHLEYLAAHNQIGLTHGLFGARVLPVS